jgi:hypothetical protein
LLQRRKTTPDEGLELVRGLTQGTGLNPSLGLGTLGFPKREVTRSLTEVLPQQFPERASRLWPSQAFYFSTGPTPALGDLQGPMIAPGQPPILEPWRAVNQWIGMGMGIWPVVTRNFLEVVLPDLRAGIRTITFNEDATFIQVDISSWSREDLEFSDASSDGVSESALTVTPRGEGASIAPGPPWSQLAFFISAKGGTEVIDWARLYSTIAYPPALVKWSVPEQQLQRLIDQWETQTVEFKSSAADLGDVVQSVVAFANSGDGAIVIGVDETRNIVGVRKADKVEERIRQAISEFCDPIVNPAFSSLDILGRTVLIVSVAKGLQAPYVHRGRGAVYIRRGAYDFPTKTRKELDNLYPAASWR